MIAANPDRNRLEEMVHFAAAYRGWTTKQLGEALRRDPACLIPQSGTPKIDLVVRLANALDWPPGDLLDHLSEPAPRGAEARRRNHRRAGDGKAPARSREPGFCFEDDIERLEAVRSFIADGDIDAAIEQADELDSSGMASIRSEAGLLLADCLDRRGRPMRALAALQRAAAIAHIDPALHLTALSRLADAYHRTGQLVEAKAIASDVTVLADRICPRTRALPAVRLAVARSRCVRAACMRDAVLDGGTPTDTPEATEAALAAAAAELCELDGPEARGLAIAVDAGNAVIAVTLGARSITSVVNETMSRLDAVVDPTDVADRCELVGLGWWCVLVGSAAMGALPEGAELHRTLAILTNKGDEIAGAVDCWALRERVLTLEHGRRSRLAAFTGDHDPWLLDRDDLRMVIGCMGASRRFRPLGMKILRQAIYVRESGG